MVNFHKCQISNCYLVRRAGPKFCGICGGVRFVYTTVQDQRCMRAEIALCCLAPRMSVLIRPCIGTKSNLTQNKSEYYMCTRQKRRNSTCRQGIDDGRGFHARSNRGEKVVRVLEALFHSRSDSFQVSVHLACGGVSDHIDKTCMTETDQVVIQG